MLDRGPVSIRSKYIHVNNRMKCFVSFLSIDLISYLSHVTISVFPINKTEKIGNRASNVQLTACLMFIDKKRYYCATIVRTVGR